MKLIPEIQAAQSEIQALFEKIDVNLKLKLTNKVSVVMDELRFGVYRRDAYCKIGDKKAGFGYSLVEGPIRSFG